MSVRILYMLLSVAVAAACGRSDVAAARRADSIPASRAAPIASVPAYDGRWWARADTAQRREFIVGFVDCKSTDVPGPPSFGARSFVMYRDSVTAYYASDSARLKEPFFAVLARFGDRPGERPPAGGETYPEPHGYLDGQYWLQLFRPERVAFVEGYLACRRTLAHRPHGRFALTPSGYAQRVDAWYGLNEQTGDVRADREDAKIADVLQRVASDSSQGRVPARGT